MRGMKKWLPFKSLTGQYEYINAMKQEREKVAKPELSLDAVDDLNHSLTTLKKGDITEVCYYSDGRIIKQKAVFLRCNGYNKTVEFKGFTLQFESLLKFE